MKRKFRVIKARKGFGGGADASKSDFGTKGPPDKGDARSEYLSKGQYSTKGPKGTKDGGNKTPPKTTTRPGPFQVPSPFSYTITGQVINRVSKGLYDAKNLKDQKNVDVLGGEMLTTGPTGPKAPRGGGNKNITNVNQPIQAIAATKPVDQTLVSPKDNFFNFVSYKVGGLSGGVSYGPPPKRGPNSQVPPVKMKRGGYKK